MPVNSLSPKFTNKEGYLSWRATWRTVYRELSKRIRERKHSVKALQRSHSLDGTPCGSAQKDLLLMRWDARKMMTLLKDAKERRDRILQMHTDIWEQPFPLEVDARTVDVFYNRGHNEFEFLPRWVVRANGASYYVDHIDSTIPWSTRELDSGSTKGMLRFRKTHLTISRDGIAKLDAQV